MPAGAFTMGCLESDPHCFADEWPEHRVELSAFEIDRTEVTIGSYLQCVEAEKCIQLKRDLYCHWTNLDAPARCVDWWNANAYCEAVGKRLCTEAEWEKAARGDQGAIFPWGNEPPNCRRTGMVGCGGKPLPVGSRPAGVSPYGAYDMSGNVAEWVADYYSPSYYAESPARDPRGPTAGEDRVQRGGGFRSSTPLVRTTSRHGESIFAAESDAGFRCCR